MGEGWKSSSFTTEFGHEFEAERGRWLRKRFLWYTGVSAGFNGVLVLMGLVALLTGGPEPRHGADVLNFGVGVSATLLYLAAFLHVRRKPVAQRALLDTASLLIIVTGLISLTAGIVLMELLPDVRPLTSAGIAAMGAVQIFLAHFVACLFLPWTPRECFKPVLPLLAVNALVVLIYTRSALTGALTIGLSPLIGLPGAAMCWWRHSRFRDRFALTMLRGRYMELRQELTNARQIHESLFPKPCPDGPVRFSYVYEPMRQIGGDYLYACFTPGTEGKALNLALIDVTGHGIPAALTVNRLHGELDRIFAENPATGPGELLTLLNRYVHLTLATHSVYVTAICFRVDPGAGTLEYASGGHPPAFLRAVDGTIEQLDSTSFVLGACAGGDFRAEPRSLRFGPGDTLLAYTDGATEARNALGKFLGVRGIQKLLAAARPDLDGGWPATILRHVEQHRQGPPADDTLLVEIFRPLGGATRASARDGKELASVRPG